MGTCSFPGRMYEGDAVVLVSVNESYRSYIAVGHDAIPPALNHKTSYSLRRAPFPVPSQVFENGFDSNLGPVKSPLVGLDH